MNAPREAVIDALKIGDKPWTHIGTIQESTKLEEQVVRDTLAVLLRSDTVDLGIDPRVTKPISALMARLSDTA